MVAQAPVIIAVTIAPVPRASAAPIRATPAIGAAVTIAVGVIIVIVGVIIRPEIGAAIVAASIMTPVIPTRPVPPIITPRMTPITAAIATLHFHHAGICCFTGFQSRVKQ